MSFIFSWASWQGIAILALVMPAGAAAGLCTRVAKVYARSLMAGAQPDGPCLRAALLKAIRIQARTLRLAWQAWRRRRPGILAMSLQRMLAALPAAVGLVLTLGFYGCTPQALVVALGGMTLLLLAHIDARSGLLPDALTLPLLWLGLAAAWAGWGAASLHDALGGAMAGYGALWLLAQCFRLWRGIDGMGCGDLKLLAALGAWVGWQALPWLLLAACLAGIAFAMWRQRTWLPAGAYPFGPFLAAAGAGVFMATTGVHLWFYG